MLKGKNGYELKPYSKRLDRKTFKTYKALLYDLFKGFTFDHMIFYKDIEQEIKNNNLNVKVKYVKEEIICLKTIRYLFKLKRFKIVAESTYFKKERIGVLTLLKTLGNRIIFIILGLVISNILRLLGIVI